MNTFGIIVAMEKEIVHFKEVFNCALLYTVFLGKINATEQINGPSLHSILFGVAASFIISTRFFI